MQTNMQSRILYPGIVNNEIDIDIYDEYNLNQSKKLPYKYL